MRVSAKSVKEGDVLLDKGKRLTVESIEISVVPLTCPVRYAIKIHYIDESGNRSFITCSDNFPLDLVTEVEE